MKKKILLVHGWNPVNYTSSECTDAWFDRSKFVDALSQYFIVVKMNLRGFGGTPDPMIPWTLSSYAGDLSEVIERERPDYVLGYSFGGAVVLSWKTISKDKSVKAFLVSPAIVRQYEHVHTSRLAKALKVFLSSGFVSFLRDVYLVHWIKNPYYSRATKVMRETYRNIVGVDLRQDLLEVPDRLTLIYGEHDTATPPNLVKSILAHSTSHHDLHIIRNGDHDIANTHTNELVKIIKGETE